MLPLHAMPIVHHVQIGPCISLEKSSLFDRPWLMVVKAEEVVRSLGCTSEGMSPRMTVNIGRVRSQTRNFVLQTRYNIMCPRLAHVDRWMKIAMTRHVVLGWIQEKDRAPTICEKF